jgi:hypothetical protein
MRYFFFFLMATLSLGASAQSLSRQSMHALGGTLQSSSLTLQQTLAQSSNHTVFNAQDLSLRQGFLQGYLNHSAIHSEEGSLTLFPNPNHGSFTLRTHFNFDHTLMLHVFNAIGEEVLLLECPAAGEKFLNLSLAPGLYFLSAQLSSQKSVHTKFIITP